MVGKGIYFGAARSEAGSTQGLDVHLIGAGNSAGQAALFFANHARTVTLVVRGNALDKSMSRYLVEQVRGKANIGVELQSEVQAVHGDEHLTAIDILDRASGIVRRRDCAGLFVFIGADAETGNAIMSIDGRYVVFETNAQNLLSGVDTNGKTCKEIPLDENKMQVDVSELAKGIYFIQSGGNQFKFTKKISIQ